jgi:hypothetical protein
MNAERSAFEARRDAHTHPGDLHLEDHLGIAVRPVHQDAPLLPGSLTTNGHFAAIVRFMRGAAAFGEQPGVIDDSEAS